MMSREAMKLALEALESDPISHAGLVNRKQAITALRQALETEQESHVNLTYHADGNVGIGTPSQVKWDASASLVMGEPVERMRISMTDGVRITPNQEPIEYTFTPPATEWARIDKDMNVVHLDMELCAKGPHNAYTALAMAIWKKAIETEREACAKVCEERQEVFEKYYTKGLAGMCAEAIRARSKCERGDAGTKISEDISCKTHPDAPHGFDRNMSHTLDRYVCECESWEPKQEPVECMFVNEDGECEQIEYGPVFDDPGVTPLYAAPPKREWIGLTDEERDEIISYASYALFPNRAIAISIEAKLKDKNI
jgi:hypothetical protein